MATTQPIRSKAQIRALSNYYLKLGQLRNHLLIVFSLHTALRISDVLGITWDDVYDFATERVTNSITLTEKKTGKAKTLALHKSIVSALEIYAVNAKHGEPLFLNSKTGAAISRIQAYRLIR